MISCLPYQDECIWDASGYIIPIGATSDLATPHITTFFACPNECR